MSIQCTPIRRNAWKVHVWKRHAWKMRAWKVRLLDTRTEVATKRFFFFAPSFLSAKRCPVTSAP